MSATLRDLSMITGDVREKICRMFRESRLSEISTIYQDDAGTHFLLHVRDFLK
ncbi:MAG: hypothetical protein ACLR7D_03285 [Lachnospira eligens]